MLDGQLPENMPPLLKVDKLKSMLSCDVDGPLDNRDCSEGTPKLVDLSGVR